MSLRKTISVFDLAEFGEFREDAADGLAHVIDHRGVGGHVDILKSCSSVSEDQAGIVEGRGERAHSFYYPRGRAVSNT